MSDNSQSIRVEELENEIRLLKDKCDKAERSEKRFLEALKLSPMALCHHDTELRYTWLYNGHMGFVQEDVIGKTDWDILEKDLADRMSVIKKRVLSSGVGERVEMPSIVGDDNSEYFDLVVEPMRDDSSGEILGLICSGIDVTEDRRRREAYRASEENLRFIFNASPMPIMVTSLKDGNPLFFNPAADNLFNIGKLSTASGNNSSLFSQLNIDNEVDALLGKGSTVSNYKFEYKSNGVVAHLSIDATQIFYDGEMALLTTVNDLTAQIEQQRQLEEAKDEAEILANTDVITGLYNRRAFYKESKHLFQNRKRSSDVFSLIILDIDNFKRINDSWGHHVGDKCIELLGDLLKKSIRETDIAARYGGEEFAILLNQTSLNEAVVFAEKLRLKISLLKIIENNEVISLTASFGIAQLSHENNNIDDLVKAADTALYKAKNAGRNCVKCSV